MQEIAEPLGGASKDFMAFGGGLRLCVGAEFAKLQMTMFLHSLVTKYRCNYETKCSLSSMLSAHCLFLQYVIINFIPEKI